MEKNLPDRVRVGGRWSLIRDVAEFQFKLIVDGFRDLVLVPASLIVGVISLFSGDRDRPGSQFYRLIALGKQTELWINLFGAYKNAPPEVKQDIPLNDAGIDQLLGRLESFVVDEYRRGGVTAQAKDGIDRALDAFRQRRSKRK